MRDFMCFPFFFFFSCCLIFPVISRNISDVNLMVVPVALYIHCSLIGSDGDDIRVRAISLLSAYLFLIDFEAIFFLSLEILG